MRNRREILAAGALAIPVVAVSANASTLLGSGKPSCALASKEYFPNVVVRTHRNERALFWDDLLKGRIVTVNFISTRDPEAAKITENLAKVQKLLGRRMGRDVFFYSLTRDPDNDTPEALRAFAERHGVGPGWSLVTADDPEKMHALLSRLFVGPDHFGHHAGHGASAGQAPGCSRGLVRYGNTVTNAWGSFPASSRPELIVERFDWVGFREGSTGVA
jgi:cytochrome oxidase Cu insertion factor (SCO1/SenC/PrrC family)